MNDQQKATPLVADLNKATAENLKEEQLVLPEIPENPTEVDNAEIYCVLVLRDRLAENNIVKVQVTKEAELPLVKAEFTRTFKNKTHPLGMSPQDYYVECFDLNLAYEPSDEYFIDGAKLIGEENA